MNFKDIEYIVKYPTDFDKTKSYPTILFLHGAGTRGTDINILKGHPFFSVTDSFLYDEFEFIVYAPQCKENTWFDVFERLEDFAEFVSNEAYVDSERLYCIGPSLGGYATWQLGMSRPDLFAAIVPICGGGMYWNSERLANMGVWAFHCEKDNVVLCEESRKMVDSVNMHGGHAKLTIYPKAEHDAWTETFKNKAVFSWMLEHGKHADSSVTNDEYIGSKVYG